MRYFGTNGYASSDSGCSIIVSDTETETVDCGHLALCRGSGICQYTTPARLASAADVQLDLAVDEQRASGNATFDNRSNVYLTCEN